MARELIERKFCDWCAQVQGAETPAVIERPVGILGKKPRVADFCAGCALLWDLVSSRLGWVLERLDPIVLERLYLTARKPLELDEKTVEAPPRTPRAIAAAPAAGGPGTRPAPVAVPAPRQETLTAAQSDADVEVWVQEEEPPAEKTAQIYCLECEPRRGMKYNNRTSHARSMHGMHFTQIIWEPGTMKLEHLCRIHPDCEEVGLGYPTEQGRDMHESDRAGRLRGKPTEQPEEVVEFANKKVVKHNHGGRWIDGVEQIGCPLPHLSVPEKTDTYWVAYSGASTHATAAHGLLSQEIEWIIPDGVVLKFPCTSHEACIRTKFACKDNVGLKTHLRTSKLPRIDLATSPARLEIAS